MDKYQYKILDEIGKGSFGKVYKAKKTRTNYALKKVSCDAPENVELALQEFWTLSSLRAHDNIIRFEECFLQHGENIRPMKHGDKTSSAYMYLIEMAIKGKRGWDQAQYYLWFVMEYCNSGDMNDYILDRDPIAYLNTIFMMQLAEGIAFLHKSNVVHRDLKPENVLVRTVNGKDPVLKIADFGLSKVCNHSAKDADEGRNEDDGGNVNVNTCWLSSACGSDFFMAPEVFEGRYTAKADVFSLGVMFWSTMDRITFIDAGTKKVLLGTYVRRDKEVLPVGEALLDDPNLDMTQLLVDTGQGSSLGQRSKRSHSRSCVAGNKKKLRHLIAQMVHPNPEFRPSAQELLEKLASILQPNERPKNLNLSMKKLQAPKIEGSLRESLKEPVPTPVADAPLPEKVQPSVTSISCNELEEECEKSAIVVGKTAKKLSRPKAAAKKKTPDNVSNSKKEKPTTMLLRNTRKAKQKALDAVTKIPRIIAHRRNLRSSSAKPPEAADVTGVEDEDNGADAEPEVAKPHRLDKIVPIEDVSTALTPSNSEKVEACEVRKQEVLSEELLHEESIKEKTKLNLRKYVNATKLAAGGESLPIDQDSDEGGDFLTDGDSRDSSVASEIPEFDSGYKSKNYRRISHVSDDGEVSSHRGNRPKEEETTQELSDFPPAEDHQSTSTTAHQESHPPWLNGNRHRIGLKQQICACKPSARTRESNSSGEGAVVSSEPQEASVVRRLEVPKSRLEVPREPCIVMQSKAKFCHNPFRTAVKKRWKYVVLDEDPPSSVVARQPHNQPSKSTACTSTGLSTLLFTTPRPSSTIVEKLTMVDGGTIGQGLLCVARSKSRNEIMSKSAMHHISQQRHLAVSRCPPEPSIIPSATSTEAQSSSKLQHHQHIKHARGKGYVKDGEKVTEFSCSTVWPRSNQNDDLSPFQGNTPGKSTVSKDPVGTSAIRMNLDGEAQPRLMQGSRQQEPILQHLANYWHPNSQLQRITKHVSEPPVEGERSSHLRRDLLVAPVCSTPEFMKPFRKSAVEGTKRHRKLSIPRDDIPTIDLTEDEDSPPVSKRVRTDSSNPPVYSSGVWGRSRTSEDGLRRSNFVGYVTPSATPPLPLEQQGYSRIACSPHRYLSHMEEAVRPPGLVSHPSQTFVRYCSPMLGVATSSAVNTLSRDTSVLRSSQPLPRPSVLVQNPESYVAGYQQHRIAEHHLGSAPSSDARYAMVRQNHTPYLRAQSTMDYDHSCSPVRKMPSLLYCGTMQPFPASPTFRRGPPELLRVGDLQRKQLPMQQPQSSGQGQGVFLSPPKLRRATNFADPAFVAQFQTSSQLPSSSLSSESSSDRLFPNYPYQTRHPKPILNK